MAMSRIPSTRGKPILWFQITLPPNDNVPLQLQPQLSSNHETMPCQPTLDCHFSSLQQDASRCQPSCIQFYINEPESHTRELDRMISESAIKCKAICVCFYRLSLGLSAQRLLYVAVDWHGDRAEEVCMVGPKQMRLMR
jgi:hypothetical protein